ncbi:MAG TPA: hypothetical protein VJ964_15890 [Balneolaceae bacterium]|nr:hypothetical protein [Balneolaceae bacterium]
MNYFDHPYSRFGLASVLAKNDVDIQDEEGIPEKEILAELVANYIEFSMHSFRMHTQDKPQEDTNSTLRFRYIGKNEVEESGQGSKDKFYIAPHIVTSDMGARYLIKYSRKIPTLLREKGELEKSFELKRSFSPFTAKINEGVKSRSYPKGSIFEAGFILAATLSKNKPATWVNLSNQVMIPDLQLEDLIEFIRLFDQMQSKETGNLLTRKLKAGNKNYRPPIYNGNYPYAPPSPIFGPVGLVGAMGQWAKRAKIWERMEKVLEKLVSRPIYLVSYDPNLFRQVHLGHHVKRLAEKYNLPKIINDLYHAHFYNPEHNKRDNKTRELFFEMASRFLQFYTASSFQDFLSFRLEYPHSFSTILEDYFMSEKNISKDIVQSARQYGNYLNKVAFIIGKDEAENKNTNRDLYEAKANILAQLESTAMSCKSATSLFAQLNVQAGRMSNMDVPAESSRFIEATNSGEISLDQARDLILAYMRLRSAKNNHEDSETSLEGTFSTN